MIHQPHHTLLHKLKTMKSHTLISLTIFLFLTTTTILVSSEPPVCGREANGALCPSHILCCSQWGFCGTNDAYCGPGCQSGPCFGAVGSLVNLSLFNEMLKHRDDPICPARGFYKYDDFLVSGNSFEGFSTTGDEDTRKREIAAFLAQTSHQTTGGWREEPYTWGYCKKEERSNAYECEPSDEYPCAPNKQYYGRGPMKIKYNIVYGKAGEALGVDLLNHPELVAKKGKISFDTAFWYWMTPNPPMPSCHDAITGGWTPSEEDEEAGRLAGFGATTNIINGVAECGQGPNANAEDRIGYYKRYCDMLGVSYGDNLDCQKAKPYSFTSKAVQDMK
ncbi:Chitinase 3 [Acorus gramineus]|uniref:chitinase n=1 Tax=Acorus gramineus TaxID=55184 RepID=A0AAV9B9N1_ACOGR|nr:Chitinase 3 [Acorus gramineus]